MNVTRRRLLGSAAGLSAAALAGCTTSGILGTVPTTVSTSVSMWVSGLQAIATEIGQSIPQLVSAGLGGNTLSSVQSIIGEIQSALSGVSSATTQSAGQSVLVTVENYIDDLAPLVLPFVAAIPGGSIIGLIIAALPAIEQALNLVISSVSSLAQQVAATAPTPSAKRYGAAAVSPQAYLNLLIRKANQRAAARYRRHHH